MPPKTMLEDDCALLNERIRQLSEELSRRKRAEDRLQQAKQAAESANLLKSEFLANISHEIRTPLTAILGFAEILLQTAADAEGRAAAQTILRNGQHLMDLLNGILDLSKLEAGRLQVERIECSPVEIIQQVCQLMSARAEAKGLRLQVQLDGPLPQTIRTDPMRLRQVLINLLGNAIKFTELGSVRLSVRVRRGSCPQLELDVTDTGIGMTDQQMQRIFRPFTQADASTTRRYGGTGLGLAICKRLTELLGGAISAESAPGKGSRFRVSVPTGQLDGVPLIDDPQLLPVEDEPAAETARPQLLNCRVLLAEDGPDNQRLVLFFLRQAGADVTLAVNGRDAVEKALATYPGFGRRWDDPKEKFDVILMDMQMPLMDGYEATRMIRDHGYDGPIIALTAHAMSDDRQKCLDAGCDDFLTKPIDRARLIAMLADCTRGRRCS